MCALTPFPVCEWPLDAPISYNESFEEFLHFTSTLPPIQLDGSLSFSADSGNNIPTVLKKLNHNASERDRRRKINTLYSSLRSLLPPSEQTKSLSIPAIIARVLKYIPELQGQVERLVQKKEEILSRQDEFSFDQRKKRKLDRLSSSPFAISASRVSEREVVVQISTFRAFETPLSHVLFNLQEDGLFLTDASCFESFGARVFYNLHFQVETTYNLEAVLLHEKLLALYEKRK